MNNKQNEIKSRTCLHLILRSFSIIFFLKTFAMTSIETLTSVSQQLNIYVGIILFILGIIGCLWNILIFRHRSFRISSCCTYMLIGSMASLIQLFFGLLVRILTEGFQVDWTLTNIAWCKIRNYTTQCASLTALSCLVWTAMDRFFSTCRQIKWRYLNSVYFAKQVCLLTLIFWMLISIPTIIYTKPMEATKACTISSSIWSGISIYFFTLFCYGIFPWFFMSLFGLFALKNLRQYHRQRVNPLPIVVVTRMARLDHQLTSMLFLQIIYSIISSIPYCVEDIYSNLTQTTMKTPYRQAQENIAHQIIRLAFYLNYISLFYVNYLSSPIFRRISKKALRNLFKRKNDVSRDITVINHQTYPKRKNLKISTIYGTTHM